MSWKKKETWNNKDIISYYQNNAFAYKIWGADMHFGYWEEGIKTQRQASRRLDEKLAETAQITKDDYVLDAGCGVGGNALFLAQTYGCKVVGITITPEQVTAAQARAQEAGVADLCEFYEMDYMKTTFPDETFTVVTGLESICYANPKREFIKEVYRILKPKGRFCMADGFASREEYTGRDERLMNRWMDGWLVTSLDTPGQWIQNATNTGFVSSGYRDITPQAKPTSWRMFLLSLIFLPLHILDKIIPLREYPMDALFHQYFAMKENLWEYGIFHAEKG